MYTATDNRDRLCSRAALLLLAVGALCPAPETAAHPISLPSAIVNVEPDHVQLELNVMLEDLVLLYKIEAGKDFYYPAEQLVQAAEKHRDFVRHGLLLIADEGEKLTGQFQEVDTSAIAERGVLQSELKAREVRYRLRFATRAPLATLTVSQQLGGPKPVLPAQLDLVVLQQGVLLQRSRQLPAARPASYEVDWDNPPQKAMTLEQYREQRRQQFQARLGITSYSGLYSFVYVTPREIRHEILIPLLTLESWVQIPRQDPDFVTVAEQEAVREAIADFFQSRNPVTVNGEVVDARLTRLNFFGLDIRDFALNAAPRKVSVYQARVGIILSYACQSTPRTATLRWQSFNPYANFLQSTVLAFDRPMEQHVFVKDRDILRWEAGKESTPAIEIAPVLTGISKGRVIRPDSKRAVLISTAILENIYHSFQQSGDAAIYDAMATSVRGPLLRQLFLQTKRSLLVAEQGGAIARVRSVRLQPGRLEQADRGSFQYLANWHVTGIVEHWGHIHERENQYKAILTIKADDDGWRLSAYQLVDQKPLRSETRVRGLE